MPKHTYSFLCRLSTHQWMAVHQHNPDYVATLKPTGFVWSGLYETDDAYWIIEGIRTSTNQWRYWLYSTVFKLPPMADYDRDELLSMAETTRARAETVRQEIDQLAREATNLEASSSDFYNRALLGTASADRKPD